MNCEDVSQLLDAFIDGELDPLTSVQFDRHLSECASCRAICEQYRQLQKSVKAEIPFYSAPAGFKENIRASIRHQQSSFAWRGLAIAASLIALMAICSLLYQMTRRPAESTLLAEDVVSSHIRSLMANHLSDVVSTDQHTVKPWFSGKLDFAPVVKDLASKGFPLEGGRLDYLDNRTAAALVYKRRQHTINLFIWPASEPDSNPRATTIKGFNLVHFARSHMTYWAVSDLNGDELMEFAHDLDQ